MIQRDHLPAIGLGISQIMGYGIKTIARGMLPLTLLGAKGYGARLGWINSASMAANAIAPFIFAFVTQTYGGWASFAAKTSILALAVGAAFFIPNEPKHEEVSSYAPA
ncbi:MAG: hypothetical protein AAFY99_10360 [Pseudomonadota bacterium]